MAGNQGNQWMQAKVSITSSLDYKVWKLCSYRWYFLGELWARKKEREMKANQNEQERY